MKFTLDKNITYEQAVDRMFEILGESRVMAFATSLNDYVTVRNVSCLFYDEKIYFKTDNSFRKTKQILGNPNVAMCWSGVQVEGTVKNKGLVVDEPGQRFAQGFEKHFKQSYNKYNHEKSEILIEVSPRYVEVWDNSDDGYAFQLFIDFEKKNLEVKQYDKK